MQKHAFRDGLSFSKNEKEFHKEKKCGTVQYVKVPIPAHRFSGF